MIDLTLYIVSNEWEFIYDLISHLNAACLRLDFQLNVVGTVLAGPANGRERK